MQIDALTINGSLPERERARLIARITDRSTDDAAAKGKTLTIIRPRDIEFFPEPKTDAEIAKENAEYENAVLQQSLFEKRDLRRLQACPYRFRYRYVDAAGKSHNGASEDWETTATYFKWRQLYGEEKALREMSKRFGEEYPEKGMVFAMGTMMRYPSTWLIVGVLRADVIDQGELI